MHTEVVSRPVVPSNLGELSLCDNDLSGEISSELGNLSNLTVL